MSSTPRTMTAVILTDLRGRFIELNEAAEELLGRTSQELRGLSWRDSGCLTSDQLAQLSRAYAHCAIGEPLSTLLLSVLAPGSEPDRTTAAEVALSATTIGGELCVCALARPLDPQAGATRGGWPRRPWRPRTES